MKQILITLCVILCNTTLFAAVSTKDYQKSFEKGGINELVISNRYGKIEIEQTESDKIDVSAIISVSAKTESKADEIMEFIKIEDAQSGNYLNIETKFMKDMAFKQLLSGIELAINYKISIPKGVKLRIINTNGDVILGDFAGEINADIRSGNFKAEDLKGEEFYIKQEKGSFNVANINVMTGDFRSCQINIENGNNVKLVTGDSDCKLGAIDKLNIRSTGGVMKLGQIEEMNGTSSSSKYEIQDIGNVLSMDMKMGEINVRNVHFNFSEIDIKGSFTKVGLTFMDGCGYHLELKHNKSLKMDLPRGMKLEELPTSEKNVIVGRKFVGDVKYSGKVYLNLLNGNLYIQ